MTTPADQASALAAAFVALSNLRDSKYTYVASMTLMVYDMLLTLPEEVSTMWSGRPSIGRYMFLVNRYVAPVLFIFDLYCKFSSLCQAVFVSSCKRAWLPPNILGIISLTSVESILVLRTHALYRNKALLFVLCLLCCINAATMIGATFYLRLHVITFQEATFPPPIQLGCTEQCSLPICRTLLTAFWIPFFFTETVIFGLTLWKSYSSTLGMTSHSKLVQVFYRDGALSKSFIFHPTDDNLISITNLLVWILAPDSLSYIVTSVMRALQVSVGSRILLNIRSARSEGYVSQQVTVPRTSSHELSNIHFVVPGAEVDRLPAAAARLHAQEQSIMFAEVTSSSYGDDFGTHTMRGLGEER
ncbi:hypothetical protein BD626DRAFT_405454 [Schizophyllum amplum]|uniref:DUF6533 domain-containing protein n=1 Tax=Schizophyllum amplum TaxID=97359 RepID=A0A550C9Z0_9AGAR|nr:hypothetical protein BD626DRAFT_405454 [Auriculariopsis ampla]